jgi:hypothetical protein
VSTAAKSLVGLIVVVVCGVALWYGYSRHQKAKQNTGQMRDLVLNEALPPGVPPASCPEWQTQSTPTFNYPPGRKCKVLGGTALCDHLGYVALGCSGGASGNCGPPNNAGLAGTYDIGPVSGKTQVGQPITVYFRLRDFGSGDATVYNFGKVDWGDNQQQQLVPWPNGVPVSHTYYSQQRFVIHAMAGAQFKYSTPQVGGISGSYEGCQDNSIPVTITP